MATPVYFRKELVKNKLMYKDGTFAQWELLGEGYGVAALDAEADKEKVEQLRNFIKAKRGGVLEVTKEEYEETKKKFDLVTSRPSPLVLKEMRDAPRVHNPESVHPTAAIGSVMPAVAQASARLAADLGTAAPAAAPGESATPELPKPQGRKIKLPVGKPKNPAAQPPAET